MDVALQCEQVFPPGVLSTLPRRVVAKDWLPDEEFEGDGEGQGSRVRRECREGTGYREWRGGGFTSASRADKIISFQESESKGSMERSGQPGDVGWDGVSYICGSTRPAQCLLCEGSAMACVENPYSGCKCAGDSSGENDGEYGKDTKFASI